MLKCEVAAALADVCGFLPFPMPAFIIAWRDAACCKNALGYRTAAFLCGTQYLHEAVGVIFVVWPMHPAARVIARGCLQGGVEDQHDRGPPTRQFSKTAVDSDVGFKTRSRRRT